MADDIEKTEEPTPKKRQEARGKGQLAVSQEVFVFTNILVVPLVLLSLGASAAMQGMLTFRRLWLQPTDLDLTSAVGMLRTAFAGAMPVLLPVLAGVFFAGLIGGLVQTRGNFAPKRLKPNFKKFSPAQNVKKLYKQGPIELPKSLLKVGLVGGVLALVISQRLEEYFGLSRLPLFRIVDFQLGTIFTAYLSACVVLLLIAVIDYSYQYWLTEKGLKMSRQEVKDEQRQTMGDPMVRSRIRTLRQDQSRNRMIAAVPDADVVVTNPQHLSVALQYKRAESTAPRVVAKGAGLIAMRIREIATEHGVPLVENKPVARALYRSVKVGQIVPEDLYHAVAEILAYVYRLDRTRARAW